jgi:hypothetical protein
MSRFYVTTENEWGGPCETLYWRCRKIDGSNSQIHVLCMLSHFNPLVGIDNIHDGNQMHGCSMVNKWWHATHDTFLRKGPKGQRLLERQNRSAVQMRGLAISLVENPSAFSLT